MSEVRLSAEPRTEFGKGGARRTRRAGKIPAVIYGHGAEPRHVALPEREFANAVRHGGANVLLTLELESGQELAIPKAIQRHPIKGIFEHVDLLAVRRGEKVTVEVPLSVVGEIISGGMLATESTHVSVEAEATHLPTEIEISIEGKEIGTQITAGDLSLPRGSTLITDAEHVMLIIQEAPSQAAMEAEIAGEALEAAPAEEVAEAAPAEEAPAAESGE